MGRISKVQFVDNPIIHNKGDEDMGDDLDDVGSKESTPDSVIINASPSPPKTPKRDKAKREKPKSAKHAMKKNQIKEKSTYRVSKEYRKSLKNAANGDKPKSAKYAKKTKPPPKKQDTSSDESSDSSSDDSSS